MRGFSRRNDSVAARRYRPELTASVPEGWFVKSSITLLAPNGQANVIASSEPLGPGIDTRQYAEIQGELLRREFPRYTEFWFAPVEVAGIGKCFMRCFEWQPPDGVPVTQVQMYYVREGRGYTATATTPSSAFERFEWQLHEIMNGLVLEA